MGVLDANPDESPTQAVFRLAPTFGLDGGQVVSLAQEVGMDPLTILAFVSAVLPLILECYPNSPERAARKLRRNGPLIRARVREATAKAWLEMGKGEIPPALLEAVNERRLRLTAGQMRAVFAANQ